LFELEIRHDEIKRFLRAATNEVDPVCETAGGAS